MTDEQTKPEDPAGIEDEAEPFGFPLSVLTLDEVPEEHRFMYQRRGEGYHMRADFGMAFYQGKYEGLAESVADMTAQHDEICSRYEEHIRLLNAQVSHYRKRADEKDAEEAKREWQSRADAGNGGMFARMMREALH